MKISQYHASRGCHRRVGITIVPTCIWRDRDHIGTGAPQARIETMEAEMVQCMQACSRCIIDGGLYGRVSQCSIFNRRHRYAAGLDVVADNVLNVLFPNKQAEPIRATQYADLAIYGHDSSYWLFSRSDPSECNTGYPGVTCIAVTCALLTAPALERAGYYVPLTELNQGLK